MSDSEDIVARAQRIMAEGRDDDDAVWADLAWELIPELVAEIERLRTLAPKPTVP